MHVKGLQKEDLFVKTFVLSAHVLNVSVDILFEESDVD